MLMIRTLRRVSSILPLTRRLANTSAPVILVFFPFSVVLAMVDYAVHGLVAFSIHVVIIYTKARPATSAATLALVVAGEGIPAGEPPATLRTGVWPLASVQFRVAFQVMQTAETRLASRTLIWLLLAVRQEMALEVVMAREIGRAVGALVPLGRRRLWAVLRVARQAHLPRGSARIVFWGHWAWESKCAIAGAFAGVWRNRLVVRRLWLLWWCLLLLRRLRRAFLGRYRHRAGSCFHGSCGRRGCYRIRRAKA